MRLHKKTCAAVLALLMLSGGGYACQDMPFTVQAEETASSAVWDGSYDTSWYDGEETEFHLTTAEQLAGLAKLVNSGTATSGKKFYLDADIVLNDVSNYSKWNTSAPAKKWTSIEKFAGTFDAQNHTITGMYGTDGLFSSSGGTIMNLKLESAYAQYAGVCRNSSGIVKNCHVNGTIYNNSKETTAKGGICAGNTGIITECSMNGSVDGYYHCGGICGNNSGTVSKCKNNAFVTAHSYDTAYLGNAGGIAGFNGAATSFNEVYNTGIIQGDLSNLSYVGGIVGRSAADIIIDSAYNTGTVRAYNYAGGMIGQADTTVTISNVYNTGTVTVTSTSSYAGGMIGRANTATVSNAYNTGAVTAEGDTAGGIAGYLYKKSAVSNVYNIGKVTGEKYTGGIIGIDKETSELTACYYLNSTALKGVGNKDTDTAVSKSEANMKKESFAETLGKGFVYVKDNYPELAVFAEPAEPETESQAEPETESKAEPETESQAEPETEEPTEPQKQVLKFTEYTESAKATLEYDGEITWLSSNTSVATVNDGVVTAVGNGTAVIYAICGEKRVELPVEVSYDYYFTKPELSLTAGTREQLEFRSVNNKEMYNQLAVWTSSDTSIATVDKDGVVTAVSAGTAEITAKAGDVSVTCKVTVTAPEKPEISVREKSIKKGDSLQLSVPGYEGSVTWVSSDTTVVKISGDGTLTGIKAGTATVYALLADGKTVTAEITVTEDEEEEAVVPGDADLNKKVDIMDVIVINKVILGKTMLTDRQLKAADVNHNDKPDATDSLNVMKYIVGLLESL